MRDRFGNPLTEDEARDLLTRTRHQPLKNGYAYPPGTGPEGETCGSCKHIGWQDVRSGRRFYECGRERHRWTGGTGTDVLLKAPACRGWEARP